MSAVVTTNPRRAVADGQRARVLADAVVAAYIDELARPARRGAGWRAGRATPSRLSPTRRRALPAAAR